MSECAITNIGGKFYISTSAENEDLDLAGFQELSYEEVPSMGNSGDTGITQNGVSYPTWDRTLECKGKGSASGNDPDVEFADAQSAGMDLMKQYAAVSNQNNYAFYYEWSDGSKEYNRGLVSSPQRMKGSNEDFKRIGFSLQTQQEPVEDEATSSS